jgi:hypothetical protein
MEGARFVVNFAIDTMSAQRPDRSASMNDGRASGAERNVGAVQEPLFRRPLVQNGQYLDQAVWSILDSDGRQAKAVWGPKVH